MTTIYIDGVQEAVGVDRTVIYTLKKLNINTIYCVYKFKYTIYCVIGFGVEHVVHIDGVTGSSPVQTTTIRLERDGFLFLSCKNRLFTNENSLFFI